MLWMHSPVYQLLPEVLDRGEMFSPTRDEFLVIIGGEGIRMGPSTVGSCSWRMPTQLAAAFSLNTEILGTSWSAFVAC